jgi:hypothetical protein
LPPVCYGKAVGCNIVPRACWGLCGTQKPHLRISPFFSQPNTGSKPEQLAKGLQALLARQNIGRVSMPQILYIFIYIFMARLGNILGYGIHWHRSCTHVTSIHLDITIHGAVLPTALKCAYDSNGPRSSDGTGFQLIDSRKLVSSRALHFRRALHYEPWSHQRILAR